MEDLSNLSSIQNLIQAGKWNEVGAFFNNSPQIKHLGIEVDLSDIQAPRCSIPEVQDYHLGGIGGKNINGGIISALVDLSIGLTGLSHMDKGLLATTQIQLHFLRAIPNKPFYARANISQQIGHKIFAETRIFNHQDVLSVYATGIVQVVKT